MAQAKTARGWIFLHPAGYIETDYFNTRRFRNQQGRVVQPQVWGRLFRPGCEVVRAKLTWKKSHSP